MPAVGPDPAAATDWIDVHGAGEHNLQAIDVQIPLDRLTVVTGVSGSGKSSLAFDTVFRTSQARYLSALSAAAQQFLERQHQAQVEAIEGLPAALAIDQSTTVRNARSTVGTLTELGDHLRLLYARLGDVHCPACGAVCSNSTTEALAQAICSRHGGQLVEILAPVVEDHRGERRAELAQLIDAGIAHVHIDGTRYPITDLPELAPQRRHRIDASIGQLTLEQPTDASTPPAELLTLLRRALDLGRGAVRVWHAGTAERYSLAKACPDCDQPIPAIGTRLFSFNSPHGACPGCNGLAVSDHISEDLLVADANKTLRQGALVPTTSNGYIVYSQVTIDVLDSVCRAHGFDVDTPWVELSPPQRAVVFYGSKQLVVPFGKHPLESRMKWQGITAQPREEGYYKGLIPTIAATLKRDRNKNILRFVESVVCSECRGSRLNATANAVRVQGLGLAELQQQSLAQLRQTLNRWQFPSKVRPVAEMIIRGMQHRLDLLLALGLGYLQLGRESTTLSAGEAQRVRLAGQIGNGLHGLLYVLDEPSDGLHACDQTRLFTVLRQLRDLGNTVLCVEHDCNAIRRADHLIDLGPGAGVDGGRVVFQGPLPSTAPCPQSRTLAHLRGTESIELPSQRRPGNGSLTIHAVTARNLKGFTASFLLGAFNVVSGVSGAGKSTLVDLVLARALRRDLHRATARPGAHKSIDSDYPLAKVIHIDQGSIGRTPRSNPATYTGLFEPIRVLFADLPASRDAGFGKRHFSMNVAGGRCDRCLGAGIESLGMHGLASVEVRCSSCAGRRYRDQVLAVCYRQHNIAEVLQASVDEAAELFHDVPTAARILGWLQTLGLGYLRLGQSAMTLSGGEAQRIKLATELARPAVRGQIVYILDEPSSGLHPTDLAILLQALQSLVDQGHTVIVVEHDLDVIKVADRVLDLGPGAGEEGGQLLLQGTPEQLAACTASTTGRYLAQVLAGTSPPPDPGPNPGSRPTVIAIRGATTNNLRAVDVDIPHRQLTVITGVSGSGKSSLAFDTIFAEGRRRFAENLSTQTRRLLPNLRAAPVREIHGLTPSLAIRQHQGPGSSRSTLGTLTGILDLLRILYSRAADDGQARSAREFSFNHPDGACLECGGAGHTTYCDIDRLVSHPDRPLLDGAMQGHKTGRFYADPHGRYAALLLAVGEAEGIDFHQPYDKLDAASQQLAMHGAGDREFHATWHFRRKNRQGTLEFNEPFSGFAKYVQAEYERKRADHRGAALRDLMRQRRCPGCAGERLRPQSAAVRFAGQRLGQLLHRTAAELLQWLAAVGTQLDPARAQISAQALAQISGRLQDLIDLGLDYLELDRSTTSLSGGELQRARLATQLGSQLCGITYVLDEPTLGLHPHDTRQLLARLRQLVAQRNTVIVVEHKREVIAAADHLICLGPGAGDAGGQVLSAGPPPPQDRQVTSPVKPRPVAADTPAIHITGAQVHNLRDLDLVLPLGYMTVLTGVSGSGKSTLAIEVLANSLRRGRPVGCREMSCDIDLAECQVVDQSPLVASTWTTPATYLGAYDTIRQQFAATTLAQQRGYKPSQFSLTGKGGRCEACQGRGVLRTDMDFLPDVNQVCSSCAGRGFDAATLQCSLRGLDIRQVLDLSIDQALEFFADSTELRRILQPAAEVGLGYLRLGQPGSGLSGGEAQRLKLAAELSRRPNRRGSSRRLYIFDEPSAGLHATDVLRLLLVFRRLNDAGHTVLLVEHDLLLIQCCDQVIDLGPGGGQRGGEILFAGPPKDLRHCQRSLTGQLFDAASTIA